MIRCACDACIQVTPAPWPAGLCAFCEDKCFPAITVCGVAQRASIARDSRLMLHAKETERQTLIKPQGFNLIGAALELIPNKATRRQAEFAVRAVNHLGPAVLPHAKALLSRLIKRRIGG